MAHATIGSDSNVWMRKAWSAACERCVVAVSIGWTSVKRCLNCLIKLCNVKVSLKSRLELTGMSHERRVTMIGPIA